MDGTLARALSGDGEEWISRGRNESLLPGAQEDVAGMEEGEE